MSYQEQEAQEMKTLIRRVGIGATLMCNDANGTVTEDYRIRKLTPRECWRLMGWTDEQFDKIKGVSNSQLYKQAGNGIVVNVLEDIFKNLFKGER
jgi:DNA (cytosine-5)-methyltransferase 1